jgi:heat shock protein HspQ
MDMEIRTAKFQIGEVVRHRLYPFRGVIFDVDPVFANTEDWWLSIPEHVRPRKDQPFYHLLAENADATYIAYVSEQNLLPDDSGTPIGHPQVQEMFYRLENGRYVSRRETRN